MQTTDLDAALPGLDVLYMTRVQRERFPDQESYERVKPRVNEMSVSLDKDSRACYFKQVLYGKYMRMALILKLLEV